MWIQSLGQEDPLGKEMATHSSILAWEVPWTEEPGGLQPLGLQRVGNNLATEHMKNKSIVHKSFKLETEMSTNRKVGTMRTFNSLW